MTGPTPTPSTDEIRRGAPVIARALRHRDLPRARAQLKLLGIDIDEVRLDDIARLVRAAGHLAQAGLDAPFHGEGGPDDEALVAGILTGTVSSHALVYSLGADKRGARPWRAAASTEALTLPRWLAAARAEIFDAPAFSRISRPLAWGDAGAFLERFAGSPAYAGSHLVISEPRGGHVHVQLELDIAFAAPEDLEWPARIISARLALGRREVAGEGTARALTRDAARELGLPEDLASSPIRAARPGEVILPGRTIPQDPLALLGPIICRHPEATWEISGDIAELRCPECMRVCTQVPTHRLPHDSGMCPVQSGEIPGPEYLARERARRALRGEPDLIDWEDLRREPRVSLLVADYAIGQVIRPRAVRPDRLADLLRLT